MSPLRRQNRDRQRLLGQRLRPSKSNPVCSSPEGIFQNARPSNFSNLIYIYTNTRIELQIALISDDLFYSHYTDKQSAVAPQPPPLMSQSNISEDERAFEVEDHELSDIEPLGS